MPDLENLDPDVITERMQSVRTRIADAARSSGRSASDIRLIGVTKRFPDQLTLAATSAGLFDLGENYGSELARKARGNVVSGVTWHLIGPIQRRIVPKLPTENLWVHTLSRASELERFQRTHDCSDTCFLVQINIGEESQKSGIEPRHLPSFLDTVMEYKWANICGLMTIPPHSDNPEDARRWYAAMFELAGEFKRITGRTSCELSMGMSGDFDVAIQEGSTCIRVGEALFGPRP